jgi:hypothetical protein
VVDAGAASFIFEIAGKTGKVEQFTALLVPLGVVEVAHTGVAGIIRGPEGMRVDGGARFAFQLGLGRGLTRNATGR